MCGPPHIFFSCCAKAILQLPGKNKAQEGKASQERAKERSEPQKQKPTRRKNSFTLSSEKLTFNLLGKECSV